MPTLEERKAARWAGLQAKFEAEVAAVESRNGELPRKPQPEIDAIKQQIETARIEKQAAKDSLTTLKADKQALKVTLQAQLDAAVGAAAKAPIRLAIDDCTAAIAQANTDLDAAAAALESLRLAKEEALFEERLAKDALLVGDAAKVAERKANQAREVNDRKAWLTKRSTR